MDHKNDAYAYAVPYDPADPLRVHFNFTARRGSFMRDFANDMSNERRALAEGPAPDPYPAADRVFTCESGPHVTIPRISLAYLLNEAIRYGRGRISLKTLAEHVERFGVRRKA